jgi:hypothetical protein
VHIWHFPLASFFRVASLLLVIATTNLPIHSLLPASRPFCSSPYPLYPPLLFLPVSACFTARAQV